MTFEEAKDQLNNKFTLCPIDCAEDCEVCRVEAVLLAIEALNKQIELSDFIKRLDPIEEYPLIVILRKYLVDADVSQNG